VLPVGKGNKAMDAQVLLALAVVGLVFAVKLMANHAAAIKTKFGHANIADPVIDILAWIDRKTSLRHR
jgi:hypothetical protein